MIINIFKMVKVLTKTTSYSRIRCVVTLVCNLLKYRSLYSRVLGRMRSLHFKQNICHNYYRKCFKHLYNRGWACRKYWRFLTKCEEFCLKSREAHPTDFKISLLSLIRSPCLLNVFLWYFFANHNNKHFLKAQNPCSITDHGRHLSLAREQIKREIEGRNRERY